MKKFNYLIYIGRFSPFHNGHEAVLKQACEMAEKVIVVVGSTNQPRTIKNPWNFVERKQMILAAMGSSHTNYVVVAAKDKPYNDQKWVRDIQNTIDSVIAEDDYIAVPNPHKIGIIGHSKDESSFYLKLFPQWSVVEVPNFQGINATQIREEMFAVKQHVYPTVSKAVESYIVDWMKTPGFYVLVEEYFYIQAYKNSWDRAPYAPTFVTVDAVVVQSGHVLMIKRRAAPGRGLGALPGGFVNQNERLLDAAIRELREETKIKVPEAVLRGSVKTSHVFDTPNRSLRGRTITHAYLIELPAGDLPKVKGNDDAEKAKWIPLNELDESKCFEDHYHIIQYFLGQI